MLCWYATDSEALVSAFDVPLVVASATSIAFVTGTYALKLLNADRDMLAILNLETKGFTIASLVSYDINARTNMRRHEHAHARMHAT